MPFRCDPADLTLEGFARGGYVDTPKGSTGAKGLADSIAARLLPGEYEIDAETFAKYGPDLLAALNGCKITVRVKSDDPS